MSSSYETLYKLKDNGKFYIWKIELKNIDEKPYSLVSHGQKDGKMVEHLKEIIPKANRNVEEQFNLIANRKWNDKIEKEGYSVSEASQISAPKDKLIRPMLAQTFDKSKYQGNKRCKKIEFPCWGQPKFDGLRCLMYKKEDNIVMESRKGTEFYNFDSLKNEFIKTLCKETNCVFDGELYSNTMTFEKLNGLIRLKKPNEQQQEDINTIEFYIYDIIIKDNLEATFNDRNNYLKLLSKKYDYNLIKFCPSVVIKTLNDVDKVHDKYVQNDFEGLILRNQTGKYEINKRSYDLQKYKKFMDEEFKIIDFTEGEGDEKGLIIFICETPDKKEFSVRPRGTREEREKMFLEGDYLIGQKLTVIFQEYSSDNIPRFPVGKSIRHDK